MPDLGTSFAFRHIQYIYIYMKIEKNYKKTQKNQKRLK